MKIGCVDVGGGVRDIYGAGIYDYLMDEGILLDYCIGVSAGSGNSASYVASQRGRNKMFYLDYLLRKEAISTANFFRTGSFLDLNYIYGTICAKDGENPLDYSALTKSKTDLTVVATDATTDEATYFNKQKDMSENDYKILMASSCLPVFCKPISINGKKYYDGGLSDPIPFKKALESGCDKIIVILTKPLNAQLNQNRNSLGASVLKRKYPNFSKSMNSAADIYTQQLKELLELQNSEKALILAPDDIMGLGTLTRKTDKLIKLYENGYRDATKIKEFLK
ncbi:MAG: patatin family protein [Eubacterium sp.]|nr:patatin family protein [Eubacterium sp.]